jgi:hypothetical protein
MISLSIFNDFGLQIFKEYIESKGSIELPSNILTDEDYSDVISLDTKLDGLKVFDDRLEMAIYLNDTLGAEIFDKYDNEPKFWSWLCCLYIEQIALKGKFSNPEHYVYSPGRIVYRHSVAMPTKIYRQHGYEISRLLVSRKMNVWGEMAEQIMGRQSITRSQALISFLTSLYYDKDKDDIKPSARTKISDKLLRDGSRSTSGGGGVRRVVLQLKRLALNYKVDAMSVGNISCLLPSEYDSFVTQQD